MDYHFQFRFNSTAHSLPNVGQPRPARFPVISAPPRPKCTGETVDGNGPAARASATPRPEVRPQTKCEEKLTKTPTQIQAQVKQLEFWLKVFSRFCQEDKGQE